MPTDDVPPFLVDQLADLDPSALRSVAAYADGESYAPPTDVPEDVRNALALQDDETLASVAAVAREFAESIEHGGSDDPDDAESANTLGGRVDEGDGGTAADEPENDGEDWWEDRFL